MPTDLAPVYLDDNRVKLQGEPKPKVATIVAAGGKQASQVVRLRSPNDEQGEAVGLEAVIDRASEAGPVYLRCVEGGETQASFVNDESSGIGQAQFGAGRPGMAGQGAKGQLDAALPADKQAKSDFTGTVGRDPHNRNGASNQTYGAGDLAPGGRTSLSEEADRSEGTHVDGSQEFQSGGRSGEGGAPPYRDVDVGSTGVADEGVGAQGRRHAGARPIRGRDPAQGAQGAATESPPSDLRDSSTRDDGTQQGQEPWRGDPTDARTRGYDDGHSSVRARGERPAPRARGSDDGAAGSD